MMEIFKKKERLSMDEALERAEIIENYNLPDYSGFTTVKHPDPNAKKNVIVCIIPKNTITNDHHVEQGIYAVQLSHDATIDGQSVNMGSVIVVCNERFGAKKKAPLLLKVMAAKAFLMFHEEASKEFALGNLSAATLHYLICDVNMLPKIAKKYLKISNRYEIKGMSSLAKAFIKEAKNGGSLLDKELNFQNIVDAIDENTGGAATKIVAGIMTAGALAAEKVNEMAENVNAMANRDNIQMEEFTIGEDEDFIEEDEDFEDENDLEFEEENLTSRSLVIETKTEDMPSTLGDIKLGGNLGAAT